MPGRLESPSSPKPPPGNGGNPGLSSGGPPGLSTVSSDPGTQVVDGLRCNRNHNVATEILNDASGDFEVTISGEKFSSVRTPTGVPSEFVITAGPPSHGGCPIGVSFTKDGEVLLSTSVTPDGDSQIVKATPQGQLAYEVQATITPC